MCAAAEAAALQALCVGTCAEALVGAAPAGAALARAGRAARALALGRFEAVAQTGGFLALGEGALAELLADDALRAPREETVLEAVARWIRHRRPPPHTANGGGAGADAGGESESAGGDLECGEGLLRLVRLHVDLRGHG